MTIFFYSILSFIGLTPVLLLLPFFYLHFYLFFAFLASYLCIVVSRQASPDWILSEKMFLVWTTGVLNSFFCGVSAPFKHLLLMLSKRVNVMSQFFRGEIYCISGVHNSHLMAGQKKFWGMSKGKNCYGFPDPKGSSIPYQQD